MIFIVIGLIGASIYMAARSMYFASKQTATEQQVPTIILWMLFSIFYLLLAITLFLISK